MSVEEDLLRQLIESQRHELDMLHRQVDELMFFHARTGLSVRAELDDRSCPTEQKVPEHEMATLKAHWLHSHHFHADWNYTPSSARPESPAARPPIE